MIARLARTRLDPFILLLLFTVVAATLVPARGADVAGTITSAAASNLLGIVITPFIASALTRSVDGARHVLTCGCWRGDPAAHAVSPNPTDSLRVACAAVRPAAS
jgi:predicted Na+-dependent transporter